MTYNELELYQKSVKKFSQFGSNTQNDINTENSFGEIIHFGKLSWLSNGAHLQIFSLKDGQRICSYHFDSHEGYESAIITTVTQIECENENCCFLAVGLQVNDSVGSVIAIYSVQGSKILRCIEIPDRITCCAHVSEDITKRTFLQLMRGCLAVGTDVGKLILLDINFKKCEEALLDEGEGMLESVPCHVVKSSLDFPHIRDHYKDTLHENFNFGIELENVEGESFVLSFLVVPPALSLLVGLEDGRMIIYDLTELQILYILLPQQHLSPLSKMTYLQPQDDPRPMIYIWAFHENPESCFAAMHCLMFEKKSIDENDEIVLYEEFLTSHVKLVLTMNEKNSLPIRCQAVTKLSSKEEDDSISICMLAWKTKTFTQILIFDMNQWYKEEMPEEGDWRQHLTYLSSFRVTNLSTFDIYFDKNTVSHFNSIQRIEEHFYPISLTFDFVFLLSNSSIGMHWPGLQYRALEVLNTGNAMAILEPGTYFNEIKSASLLPQFYESELKKTPIPLNTQREILLSVALEYNLIGILKNCARTWADGSCIGQKPYEGLSLSTLTDWIWKRAGALKQRCNKLCIVFFDYSGRVIDQHSKKELFHLTRQLKVLADLLEIILTNCKQHIPNYIFERLKSEWSTIRTASEYQEVLQWLVNIGLLPEGLPEPITENSPQINSLMIPYPYKLLENYYKTQRQRFAKINSDLIKSRTNGCRLLYIDSFIEHKCNVEALKEHWQTQHGQAAYPPSSMQALLRTLLVPDVSLETKHAILIYAFLDLNMAVVEESYTTVVQNLIKFPAVFKLNASLIKTVQAFWNLDHGQFEVALEEIICPFLHEKKLEQWEQELLVESLLVQENPSLALRALQARSATVNPELIIKIYVANNLISEAFHLARSKKSPELMQIFVRCCEYVGKWNILRDLALSEEEEKIVEDLLKESKNSKPENVYLMYMLQKCKYIEAKTYIDDIRSGNIPRSNLITNTASDFELSNTLLSAYNSTMTPLSKNLNECYYNLRNTYGFFEPKQNKNTQSISEPFSAELLKDNKRTLNDGLFKSSVLCIDRATNYWNQKSVSKNREERMMQTNNVPFVRKPQLEAYVDLLSNTDLLAYPEMFKEPKKRRLDSEEESVDSNGVTQEDLIHENRKKKMRFSQPEDFSIFGESDYNNLIYNRHDIIETSLNNTQNKDLLNTPIVVNCKFAARDRLGSIKDKTVTPHSILKVKNLIRSNSPSVLRPVKISNSKPIQYEYSESECVSETAESESETNENLVYSNNLTSTTKIEDRNLSANNLTPTTKIDDSLSAYYSIRSERTYSDMTENKCSPESKADDIENNLIEEKTSTTTTSIATGPNYPKGRKSIRTLNTSVASLSTTQYFSPVKSMNDSQTFSLKDSDCESDMKSNSSQENSLATSNQKTDNEISKDSGAILGDLSISLKEQQKKTIQPKLSGPKLRRPLRRSETPPKTAEGIQLRSRRIVRSEEMSDSDMFTRVNPVVEKLRQKTEIKSPGTARAPLSRIVAEKNLIKNIALSSYENFQKTTTTSKDSSKEVVVEYESDLYKTSTNEFNPLTCSSKLTETLSKFTGQFDKKISDQTTVIDDMSLMDTTEKIIPITIESSSSSSKTEDNRQKAIGVALMTTVEVTSTSLFDATKTASKVNETSKTTENEMDVDYYTAQSSELEANLIENETKEQNIELGKKEYEIMESEDEEIIEEDSPDPSEKNKNNENIKSNVNNEGTDVVDISTAVIDISSSSETSTEPFFGIPQSEVTENSCDGEANLESTTTTDSDYNCENSGDSDDYLMDEIVLQNQEYNTNSADDYIDENTCESYAIENYSMDDSNQQKIVSDSPISVSSSLDSTVEASNDDIDISKNDEPDVIETAQPEDKKQQTVNIEDNENNIKKKINESEKKIMKDDEKNVEKTPIISEVRGRHSIHFTETKNPLTDAVEVKSTEVNQLEISIQPAENTPEIKEKESGKTEEKEPESTEDKEKHDPAKKSEQGNHEEKSNTQEISEQVDVIEMKEETSKEQSKETEKNNNDKNESSKIETDKNNSLEETKQPNNNNRNVRAQTTDREIPKIGSPNSPKRSLRAISEQPNNELVEKVKKVEKKVSSPLLLTPNTIMTRRRSRLLERIEEDSIHESPSDNTRSKKRLDSHNSSRSDTSFTLNVEPDSPNSVSPETSHIEGETAKQLSSLKAKTLPVTPQTLTPRRRTRGVSLAQELAPVTEEINQEEVLTPKRRQSRRLSIQKDNTPETGTNEEKSDDVSAIKKRRNSMTAEVLESNQIPRRTRAASSLRDFVLTPKRRNSRAASLTKELSDSIKEEESSTKTPIKTNKRRLSQNESTPKQLFQTEEELEDNLSSNISDKDVKHTEESPPFEGDENKNEDYSMERRLTRNQKNMLEKSAHIKADQSMIPLKKRPARNDLDDSTETISPNKSDNVSVISAKSSRSRRSNTSKRTSLRGSKKKIEQHDDDENEDLESIVSSLKSSASASNRTPRRKKKDIGDKLNIITEKDKDNDKDVSDAESNSTIQSGLRSRRRAKKVE